MAAARPKLTLKDMNEITFHSIQPVAPVQQPGEKQVKKKDWSGWFYALLLTPLLIMTALILISGNALPIPYRLYAVESGSMEPTIRKGDVIFVSPQPEYNVGDIISFNAPFGQSVKVITHRIVASEEGGTLFTTRGDFNRADDLDRVDKEDVIGKYSFRIPLIGYPIQFVKTGLGVILLIVVPGFLIILNQINRIRDEIHKRKYKEHTIY
jgi:signal peptidase